MKLLHLLETEPFEIQKNRDDVWNGDNATFPDISCGYASVLSIPLLCTIMLYVFLNMCDNFTIKNKNKKHFKNKRFNLLLTPLCKDMF